MQAAIISMIDCIVNI